MPVSKTDVRSNQDLVRKLRRSSSAEVILVGEADMNALISDLLATANTVKMLIADLQTDADRSSPRIDRQQDASQLAHALMPHVVAEIIWEGSEPDAHGKECVEKTTQQSIV